MFSSNRKKIFIKPNKKLASVIEHLNLYQDHAKTLQTKSTGINEVIA